MLLFISHPHLPHKVKFIFLVSVYVGTLVVDDEVELDGRGSEIIVLILIHVCHHFCFSLCFIIIMMMNMIISLNLTPCQFYTNTQECWRATSLGKI